jgi:hypothetical protein
VWIDLTSDAVPLKWGHIEYEQGVPPRKLWRVGSVPASFTGFDFVLVVGAGVVAAICGVVLYWLTRRKS